LLVEDDRQLNEINRRALERAGYEVVAALNLRAARDAMTRFAPDVIILDIGLPDGNGADFCREVRPQTAAPILFLTSYHDYEDELSAMLMGGDDYLRKPFDLTLLVAKVDAFRRRDRIAEWRRSTESLQIGPLRLDMVSLVASVGDTDLRLTSKEFSLLVALVRAQGEVLTAEDLYEAAWRRPMHGDPRAVWTHMSCLKKKLKATGAGVAIESHRGQGYTITNIPDHT
jgi:DNA-binding response OmpR family regulator